MDFLQVLALAALPAAGNFVGGLLAEMVSISRRRLSLALHLAAGIVLAVVGVELMPKVLATNPPWVPIVTFAAGGAFFLGADASIHLVQHRLRPGKSHEELRMGPWSIFLGVAMDLLSDGIMIGAGSSVSFGLGLLLALGQVPADIPEGFATIANLKAAEISRAHRMLLNFLFLVPVLGGATIGFWILRGQPEIWKLSVLAFTAGILTTMVVEEIVPEAHQGEEESRWSAATFIAGFVLFMFLSAYLG